MLSVNSIEVIGCLCVIRQVDRIHGDRVVVKGRQVFKRIVSIFVGHIRPGEVRCSVTVSVSGQGNQDIGYAGIAWGFAAGLIGVKEHGVADTAGCDNGKNSIVSIQVTIYR